MYTSGLAAFLGRLLNPLGIMEQMERAGNTVDLSLTLPLCPQCARTVREVEPTYIDFEARRIDLIVHKDFNSALDRL